MANKLYQKTYTRLSGITKATVTLNAPGVSNEELAIALDTLELTTKK